MSNVYNIKLEVIKILERGECPRNHKVGDKFSLPEDAGKICGAAYHSIFPYVVGMQYGCVLPWEENPDISELCCPDPNNPVVFRITRTKIE